MEVWKPARRSDRVQRPTVFMVGVTGAPRSERRSDCFLVLTLFPVLALLLASCVDAFAGRVQPE
jgi:nitrate reductase NapE component